MKEMKHVTALAGAALSLVCVAGTVTFTEETGVIRDFRFAARETASDGTLPLLPVFGHILAGIEPEI